MFKSIWWFLYNAKIDLEWNKEIHSSPERYMHRKILLQTKHFITYNPPQTIKTLAHWDFEIIM